MLQINLLVNDFMAAAVCLQFNLFTLPLAVHALLDFDLYTLDRRLSFARGLARTALLSALKHN